MNKQVVIPKNLMAEWCQCSTIHFHITPSGQHEVLRCAYVAEEAVKWDTRGQVKSLSVGERTLLWNDACAAYPEESSGRYVWKRAEHMAKQAILRTRKRLEEEQS